MPATLTKKRLLVVDDAEATREVLQRNLTRWGFEVQTAASVAEAVQVLDRTRVDIVITDLKMPGASGLDLVRHVRENLRDTAVITITGYPSIEGAVHTVKLGVEDYLAKPFTQEELLAAVDRALRKLDGARAIRALEAAPSEPLLGLVGESDAMRQLLESVAKAASSSDSVLITGESGTEKDLVARAIHFRSDRAPAPFIPVDCSEIPAEFLEGQLFGHDRGAHAQPLEARQGFLRGADGGTIFLDQIQEMSLPTQVKLLRALQESEAGIGSSARAPTAGVRVLAAADMDLAGLVGRGAFREDLHDRIAKVTIRIPPLRERSEDVPLLVHYFASRFARRASKPAPAFSEHAVRLLRDYPWPANVREVENVLRRLVGATGGSAIDAPDLPPYMRISAVREPRVNRTLAEVELEHVRAVVESVNGNKTLAAEVLGIDRKTLREKLKDRKRTRRRRGG